MIRPLIQGALAGLAATAPMTAAMMLGHRRLPWHERYPLPPRQITMRVASAVGVRKYLDEDKKRGMTLVAHYGYGAAMGTLFGAMTGTASKDQPACNIGQGMAFGLGVWAAGYLGLLPALGIFRPATQHPTRRNLLMVGSHVVWGASLAQLYRTLQTTDPVDDRHKGDPSCHIGHTNQH